MSKLKKTGKRVFDRPRRNARKKTKAERQRAFPLRNAAKRAKRKRANRSIVEQMPDPKIPSLFGDPIFMHHLASIILRYLELLHPAEFDIMTAVAPDNVDAEFLPPEQSQ